MEDEPRGTCGLTAVLMERAGWGCYEGQGEGEERNSVDKIKRTWGVRLGVPIIQGNVACVYGWCLH